MTEPQGAFSPLQEAQLRSVCAEPYRSPSTGPEWALEIVAAPNEQTAVVTGTNAAALAIPRLAAQLTTLRRHRDEVAAEVGELVDAHPPQPVLMSMPESASVQQPDSSPKSPANTSPLWGTSPPTPASHPSPEDQALRSEAIIRRGEVTKS